MLQTTNTCDKLVFVRVAWRNWLAHRIHNPEVGGSIPPATTTFLKSTLISPTIAAIIPTSSIAAYTGDTKKIKSTKARLRTPTMVSRVFRGFSKITYARINPRPTKMLSKFNQFSQKTIFEAINAAAKNALAIHAHLFLIWGKYASVTAMVLRIVFIEISIIAGTAPRKNAPTSIITVAIWLNTKSLNRVFCCKAITMKTKPTKAKACETHHDHSMCHCIMFCLTFDLHCDNLTP